MDVMKQLKSLYSAYLSVVHVVDKTWVCPHLLPALLPFRRRLLMVWHIVAQWYLSQPKEIFYSKPY